MFTQPNWVSHCTSTDPSYIFMVHTTEVLYSGAQHQIPQQLILKVDLLKPELCKVVVIMLIFRFINSLLPQTHWRQSHLLLDTVPYVLALSIRKEIYT